MYGLRGVRLYRIQVVAGSEPHQIFLGQVRQNRRLVKSILIPCFTYLVDDVNFTRARGCIRNSEWPTFRRTTFENSNITRSAFSLTVTLSQWILTERNSVLSLYQDNHWYPFGCWSSKSYLGWNGKLDIHNLENTTEFKTRLKFCCLLI